MGHKTPDVVRRMPKGGEMKKQEQWWSAERPSRAWPRGRISSEAEVAEMVETAGLESVATLLRLASTEEKGD